MAENKEKTTKASTAEDSLTALLSRVRAAQVQYAQFSQEQVDEIFRAAATAANGARIRLAEMSYIRLVE